MSHPNEIAFAEFYQRLSARHPGHMTLVTANGVSTVYGKIKGKTLLLLKYQNGFMYFVEEAYRANFTNPDLELAGDIDRATTAGLINQHGR